MRPYDWATEGPYLTTWDRLRRAVEVEARAALWADIDRVVYGIAGIIEA